MKKYHHFKGNGLSKYEKVQRKVVEILLNSKMPDSRRESSIVFELKHSSECVQVARILAQKRHLDIGVAEVAAVLHDIHVIVNGTYKNHAKLGGPVAEKILKRIAGFSPTEIGLITEAVSQHSEKDIHTNKPYVELIKDADVFDCSFLEHAEEEYKRIKSPEMFGEYKKRVIKVRKELGLSASPIFRM